MARYNGPANSDDEATGLALDASGNIYVTGGSVGLGTGYDYATVKYDSAGLQQWVARYNGPGEDRATALRVDGSGNV
ncbi:MAG: SBBP repeat-containing protein, partial [bacterium]